jgi:hypothetical protein
MASEVPPALRAELVALDDMQFFAQASIRSTSGSSSLRPSAPAIRTWWTEASMEWSI